MLRFTHSLELTFRHQEPRFSHEFWKGLGCAALFHALLFIIFRIATMPNLDTLRPIAPVHVEIDLGTRDSSAQITPSQPISYAMESIPPPTLEGLMSHFFETIEAPPFAKKMHCSRPDFSELERIEYIPLTRLP